jgi:hypothetical protein
MIRKMGSGSIARRRRSMWQQRWGVMPRCSPSIGRMCHDERPRVIHF